MVITTVNNNKLFVQFDQLVKSALIYIKDEEGFEKQITVIDSEFEVIDLPEDIKRIYLKIILNENVNIIKIINVNK